MARGMGQTESSGVGILGLAASAVVLGLIVVCWLLLASQSNLLGDHEAERRMAEQVSRGCLQGLVRCLTPEDTFDPKVSTASLVAREPVAFRGRKMADLAFDEQGRPADSAPVAII